MLAGTVTTARLGGVLATTTTLSLGERGLAAATTELELARHRTNEVSNQVRHLVYLLTRMLFSAAATSTSLLGMLMATTTLWHLLSLGAVLTTTRGGRRCEVGRRVRRSGLGRKESKGIPPLLVGSIGGDVGRRRGCHHELLVVYINFRRTR